MNRMGFVFNSSNNETPFRTVLFEKHDFEMLKYGSCIDKPPSWVGAGNSLPFFDEDNENGSFKTPPTGQNTLVTPMAPKKPRKQCKTVDLKPKKLTYSDDESVGVFELQNSTFSNWTCPNSGLLRQQNANTRGSRKSTDMRAAKCKTTKGTTNVALGTQFGKRQLRLRDKENVKSVVTKSEKKPNSKNNTLSEHSVGSWTKGEQGHAPISHTNSTTVKRFDSEDTILSQCDANVDAGEKLRWLQPRRDVGLYVECCRANCKKWRYTDAYHDPVDVPTIWYCEMNPDKSMASCSIPEKPIVPAIKEDLIENKYNAGSIVWVKVNGFPWWPAIVNDSPETFTYYKLRKNSIKPCSYYVTFFEETKFSYAWVCTKYIKPFQKYTYNEMVKKTTYYRTDYKDCLVKAYKIASCAVKLTILERLQRFSSLAKHENLYNNNHNPMVSDDAEVTATNCPSLPIVSDSEDEIPLTQNTHMTLKMYHSLLFSGSNDKKTGKKRINKLRQCSSTYKAKKN